MGHGYAAARAPAVGEIVCFEAAERDFIMIAGIEVLIRGASSLVPELDRPRILDRAVMKLPRSENILGA